MRSAVSGRIGLRVAHLPTPGPRAGVVLVRTRAGRRRHSAARTPAARHAAGPPAHHTHRRKCNRAHHRVRHGRFSGRQCEHSPSAMLPRPQGTARTAQPAALPAGPPPAGTTSATSPTASQAITAPCDPSPPRSDVVCSPSASGAVVGAGVAPRWPLPPSRPLGRRGPPQPSPILLSPWRSPFNAARSRKRRPPAAAVQRDNREKHGSTPRPALLATAQGAILQSAASSIQCKQPQPLNSTPSLADDVIMEAGASVDAAAARLGSLGRSVCRRCRPAGARPFLVASRCFFAAFCCFSSLRR